MVYTAELVKNAKLLRKQGLTYPEINFQLGRDIPKSTFNYWFRNIKMNRTYIKRAAEMSLIHIRKLQAKSVENNKIKRQKYFTDLKKQYKHLGQKIQNIDTSLLVLSTLYICEGGKRRKGALMFGNSDPLIIKLFLKTLRTSFKIIESSFRCTVQCRADQDSDKLKNYWSEITKIPMDQFYKTYVDKRTIGIRTQREDYKGVLRIDYLNAEIYNRLTVISDVIFESIK